MLCQQSSDLTQPTRDIQAGERGLPLPITTLGVSGGHISAIQGPKAEHHMSTTNPFAE